MAPMVSAATAHLAPRLRVALHAAFAAFLLSWVQWLNWLMPFQLGWQLVTLGGVMAARGVAAKDPGGALRWQASGLAIAYLGGAATWLGVRRRS